LNGRRIGITRGLHAAQDLFRKSKLFERHVMDGRPRAPPSQDFICRLRSAWPALPRKIAVKWGLIDGTDCRISCALYEAYPFRLGRE
jgi:hypothetical protein